MPVKLLIELKDANVVSGVDVAYQAIQDGVMTAKEVHLANMIVCICNLLSDKTFFKKIEPDVEAELIKIQATEKGYRGPMEVVM